MNLKHIIRDIGYFGVGAAAVLVEAGGKAAKALVRKGEKTLQDHQDTVDDLKRRAQELCEKARERFEASSEEPAAPGMDATRMSPEERAELRRQLDEADAAGHQPVAPDAVYREDPSVTAEAAAMEDEPQATAPDVIYHAGPTVSAAAQEDEPVDLPDDSDTPAPRTADED